MNLGRIASSSTPYALGLLRIVTALLFLQHGTAKLFHFPRVAMFDKIELWSLLGVAGMIELAGGVLLLLGLCTRPVAFILSGQMAVAYFLVHAKESLYPILNQGELAALYCFVFLYFSAAGGGAFALDGRTKPGR